MKSITITKNIRKTNIYIYILTTNYNKNTTKTEN